MSQAGPRFQRSDTGQIVVPVCNLHKDELTSATRLRIFALLLLAPLWHNVFL